MIVKSFSPIQPIALTRAELREQLIELWAELLERALREDLEVAAEASGEPARLRAIERAAPPRGRHAGDDPELTSADGGVPERGQP